MHLQLLASALQQMGLSRCAALVRVTLLAPAPASLPVQPVPQLQDPGLTSARLRISASGNPLGPGLILACLLAIDALTIRLNGSVDPDSILQKGIQSKLEAIKRWRLHNSH